MYKGEANCGGILLKNGPIPASFCFIFVLFLLQFQYKIEKSVDGVLGIRTWGRRMVGTDETTELCLPKFSTTIKIFFKEEFEALCCPGQS